MLLRNKLTQYNQDLEKEAEIEPEEDTLTADVNNLNNDPSEENTSANKVSEIKKQLKRNLLH